MTANTLLVNDLSFQTIDAEVDPAIVDPGTTVSAGTTLTSDSIAVGVSSGVVGTILVQGTNTAIVATNGMTLGVLGQGILNIQNGGVVEVTAGGIDIGTGAGTEGSGTATVEGSPFGVPTVSTLTLDTLAAGMTVGDSSSGLLNVFAGGIVNLNGTQGLTIGARAGGTGVVNMSGEPLGITEDQVVVNIGTAGIDVGVAGTGTLYLETLAFVTLTGTAGIIIGESSGAVGSVSVFGSAITEGATTTGITVGAAAGATADLDVNGGGISLAGGGLSIGAGGIGSSGSVQISGGGAFGSLQTTGTAAIVVGASGSGTLTVNGANHGASINDANGITIGAGANSYGSVAVIFGGVINATNLIIDADIDHTATGTLSIGWDSTLNLGGMTVNQGGVVSMSDTLSGANRVADVLNIATTISGGGAVLTLNTGAQLSGAGIVHIGASNSGNLVNNGQITASGGTLELSSGAGAMTIATGAALRLDNGASASSSIGFSAGVAEKLIFGGGLATASANPFAISNWQTLDLLEFGNGESATAAVLSGSTLNVTVTGSFNGTYQFSDVSVAPGATTIFTTGTDAATGFSTVQLACFAEGTRIRTNAGLVRVELLREGMSVLTAKDSAPEPIIWIGRRDVNCELHPKPETVWPVRIRRGAFGPAKPVRDLLLSPDHAVLVNGGLVPVRLLINGTSINQERVDRVCYFHVELRHHDVILAEDLAVESYLDTGDRVEFRGHDDAFPRHLKSSGYDNVAQSWESLGAGHLVLAGPMLDAARRTVAGWTNGSQRV